MFEWYWWSHMNLSLSLSLSSFTEEAPWNYLAIHIFSPFFSYRDPNDSEGLIGLSIDMGLSDSRSHWDDRLKVIDTHTHTHTLHSLTSSLHGWTPRCRRPDWPMRFRPSKTQSSWRRRRSRAACSARPERRWERRRRKKIERRLPWSTICHKRQEDNNSSSRRLRIEIGKRKYQIAIFELPH